MEYAVFNLYGYVKRLSDLNKSRFGVVLERSKHESETRIAKNKMAEPVSVKFCMLYPLPDVVES
jgi:hypothetical protein